MQLSLKSSVPVTLSTHCVKSVRIRSFSDPHFLAFGLNTERYSVSSYLSIFSQNAEKYGPEKLRKRTLFTECTTTVFAVTATSVIATLTVISTSSATRNTNSYSNTTTITITVTATTTDSATSMITLTVSTIANDFMVPSLSSLDAEVISSDDSVLSHQIKSASQSSAEYTQTENLNLFFERSPTTQVNIPINDMTKFYQEDSVVSWYTFKMEWTMFITHFITKSDNKLGNFFITYRYFPSREMTPYREKDQMKVSTLLTCFSYFALWHFV